MFLSANTCRRDDEESDAGSDSWDDAEGTGTSTGRSTTGFRRKPRVLHFYSSANRRLWCYKKAREILDKLQEVEDVVTSSASPLCVQGDGVVDDAKVVSRQHDVVGDMEKVDLEEVGEDCDADFVAPLASSSLPTTPANVARGTSEDPSPASTTAPSTAPSIRTQKEDLKDEEQLHTSATPSTLNVRGCRLSYIPVCIHTTSLWDSAFAAHRERLEEMWAHGSDGTKIMVRGTNLEALSKPQVGGG
ncbi:unnamed protein product [Amoebophrya sp. A25]|nr:unnamed protein product [Amoebophrya sp. A25]|eukprot:GSA25T00001241001.1